MLGHTIDQQLHDQCHVMTLGVRLRLLISCHEYVQYNVIRCMHMLHNGLQYNQKSVEMILGIGLLKNIFLLHIIFQTRDTSHYRTRKAGSAENKSPKKC